MLENAGFIVSDFGIARGAGVTALRATGGRQALQVAVTLLSLIPISTGAAGVLLGPEFLNGGEGGTPSLDSHFRYLSGIFLGVGFAFWSTVPAIERRGARFRLLAAFVVAGGLGRLLSLVMAGLPSTLHVAGLFMELGVVPLLVLWQARVAAAFGTEAGALSPSTSWSRTP